MDGTDDLAPSVERAFVRDEVFLKSGIEPRINLVALTGLTSVYAGRR
jgi:hypothetical protein